MSTPPTIDLSPFLSSPPGTLEDRQRTAKNLIAAASSWGFWQIIGHNITPELKKQLFQAAREFFALPEDKKNEIHVNKGGLAWRGYMPSGGEGTHGRVDHKEGFYMGPEHPSEHPKVQSPTPLHGRNQWPDDTVPSMQPTFMDYMDRIIIVGKALCDALSLGLGLDETYIRNNFLQPDPVIIFRCFKYPPQQVDSEKYGIGEHTDFGLLTILNQESGGLQVLSPHTQQWVDVPVVENGIVCNVGDMLDMLSGGRLKSRPHRVLNLGNTPRISFPLFFDFSWDAEMKHFPLEHLPALTAEELEEAKLRWSKTTFREAKGYWWQYLAKKVQKVFPELELPDFDANATVSTRFAIPVPTSGV